MELASLRPVSRCSLIRRDDSRSDAAPSRNLVPIGLGPFANLGEAFGVASDTRSASARCGASCANWSGLLDEGSESRCKLLAVLLAEVNLESRTVERESGGLRGLGQLSAVEVINKGGRRLSSHGAILSPADHLGKLICTKSLV